MKRLLHLFLLTGSVQVYSQNSENLDINNINAKIYSDGIQFNGQNGFEVPKGSGRSAIYSGSLWIGGIDNSGQLRVAGERFRQPGKDFYSGPLRLNGTTDSTVVSSYDKVWKINRTTIDSFILWSQNPSSFPGYLIPQSILTWPGNGDASDGFASQLAPYFDTNGDGVYSPVQGDYPLIEGDQALYSIYNDNFKPHTETGGAPLGIEIHAIYYAYNCVNAVLNNTIFVKNRIINRSSTDLSNTYVGQFNDFDLGYFSDDKTGCDLGRQMFYVYNGDTLDGSATSSLYYGYHPPALGVLLLNTPNNDKLTNFLSYLNSPGPTGNPNEAAHFYGYLSSFWKDGMQMTYGGSGHNSGGPATKHMYPGDTDSSFGNINWMQTYSADVRAIGSNGPFYFPSGSEINFELAYLYARDESLSGDHLSSLNKLLTQSDSLRTLISFGIASCSNAFTSIEKPTRESIEIYPNPASDFLKLTLNTQIESVSIIDLFGNVVFSSKNSSPPHEIKIEGLPDATYIIQLISGEKTINKKFIKVSSR